MGKQKYVGHRSRDDVIELFATNVSSGKVNFFRMAGIDFVSGKREGPFMWDLSGEKRLIDCHCNGGVFNLGHRHPEILTTLRESLDELDIGNHHLISEQRAALADALAQTMPGEMDYSVFGVGGGEAVDLAIKIARGFTRRDKVISANGGYHGHTGLALAAGDEKYRAPFGPLAPGFIQIPFNDVQALEAALDDSTAAVIFETIPATNGILVPHSEYFASARELCDQFKVLMIIDEIQTGLGRTGKLWGIEHFDVEPDIIVLGKGLSGGVYPMAVTCFKAKYESVFHEDPFIHVSTFGGAEVGCPVAMRVLEISADQGFLDHVQALAQVFSDEFYNLQEQHGEVLVGLRQLGLMMGIEMVNELCGPIFSKAAYDSGLLSVYANNDPSVAQLLPPLNIDKPLAEEILERVDHALTIVANVMKS
ncbi:MAG: aminotransferase class III-fold pyridoxal phosphate-dependent enzyme [Anaerolineales bacterium]|nr:aminotransferase class III-fold pyridoxal phosphate-dependent enzyme [Anaerolineales bacterium]